MGIVWRVCLLCIGIYGSLTASANEIEVAIAVDGSVLEENGPKRALDQETRDKQSSDKSEDTMSSMKVKEDNNVQKLLTKLQFELTAVEQMMKLQEKKLEVLTTMRQHWMQKQQEDGKMVKRQEFSDTIERKIDAAIAETLEETARKTLDTYFVEKTSIEVAGDVMDMKMVHIQAPSAVDVLVVAYKDGQVVFYMSDMKELLRLDIETQQLKLIEVKSLEDQLVLVVTLETPMATIYRLQLVEKRKSNATDDQRPKSTAPFTFTSFLRSEYELRVMEHHNVNLSTPACALAIARTTRHLVVAIAQRNGNVDFLALNGTLLRQFETHASISVMQTQSNILAFSNGSKVIVSFLTRTQRAVFHVCSGSAANVSSIVFDPIHTGMMFVGTQRGEILVYNVFADDSHACRLLSRSFVSKGSRLLLPVALVRTKTYVIAATYHEIAVFNVSKTQQPGVFLSQICSNRIESLLNLIDGALSHLILAFSDGYLASHLAIVTVTSSGSTTLFLFHSLLPEEGERSDVPWMTIVYVLLIVILLIVGSRHVFFRKLTSGNEWKSRGKKALFLPNGRRFDTFQTQKGSFESDSEAIGQYASISEELRQKIAHAKSEAAYFPMHDDVDDDRTYLS